jgi:hypothetical protein
LIKGPEKKLAVRPIALKWVGSHLGIARLDEPTTGAIWIRPEASEASLDLAHRAQNLGMHAGRGLDPRRDRADLALIRSTCSSLSAQTS